VTTALDFPAAPGIRPARLSSPNPSLWVKGPAWDSVFMLNGLWLAPLVLWLANRGDAPNSPLDMLYFAITALFWIGHRLSSTWLAYATEAYRPLLRAQPVRFVVLPLLITLGCFAIFLPPDGALPFTRAQRLVLLAVLDYGFGIYHFAGQHFGALSLYRMRAGRARCASTRNLDRLFALGVGGGLIFVADVVSGSVAYQDRWIGGWFPDWMVAAQEEIRWGAMALLLVATAAILVVEFRAARPSLPRILYMASLSLLVAIALTPRSLFPFLVLWTSQHWILATGFASRTASAKAQALETGVRRLLHELNARPWAIVVLLMAVSVLLLPVFEVEANRQGGTYYGDRIFGFLAQSLRNSTWVPALIALGFASGFVHYLLDRCVYRMSNPDVRSAARGLVSPPSAHS
jgi:hypothetical protein